jgi:hypothetical protein
LGRTSADGLASRGVRSLLAILILIIFLWTKQLNKTALVYVATSLSQNGECPKEKERKIRKTG